jgi:Pentapeptide repeats (8 copies)
MRPGSLHRVNRPAEVHAPIVIEILMRPRLLRRHRETIRQAPAPEPQIVRVQVESVPSPSSARTRRDWAALSVASLPGLAAIVALVFTAQSLQATDRQLGQSSQQVSINNQAEITDRFNAAITNLSSSNTVIQLGGIYALQRIMTDSPRDQPAVLNVLCAYVRYHDPLTATAISLNSRNAISHAVSSDVQAALTVVGARNPVYDASAIVDLEKTNLANADFTGAYFARANLEGTNLTGANLHGSNLYRADLEDSNLDGSQFTGANLQEANLTGSYLQGVNFQRTRLYKATLASANVDESIISDSDLR